MDTFIYYFGSISFAVTTTRIIVALINYLENGGKKK